MTEDHRDYVNNFDFLETKNFIFLNFINMTIYNIYIFDKSGILLYYHEWNRFKQSGMTKEEVCFDCENSKLVFNTLYFRRPNSCMECCSL